jgi:hypothetical protein
VKLYWVCSNYKTYKKRINTIKHKGCIEVSINTLTTDIGRQVGNYICDNGELKFKSSVYPTPKESIIVYFTLYTFFQMSMIRSSKNNT